MAITFTYNGSTTVTASIPASSPAINYDLSCGDPSSTQAGPTAGTGGTLVLTVSNVGGLIAGQSFEAAVLNDVTTDFYAATVFTFGSTAEGGVGGTWSFDGNKTVSVMFASASGTNYRVIALGANGFPIQNGVGTGGNLTITLVAPSALVGSFFDVALFNMDVLGGMTIADRLFTGGSAGAGTAGNPGGGETPPTTPPNSITFHVNFYDHSANLLVTLTPVDNSLSWTYRLANVNGPAEISCDFALSETLDGTPGGTPLITQDLFAPYASDFALTMTVGGESPVKLLDGIVTGVNLSSETGRVSFTGMDYSHYLEQPYPFDYSQTVAQWLAVSDSTQYWQAVAQQTVVGALVSSLASAGYDANHPTIAPAYFGSTWSNTINYRIPWGDSTTILAHLQTISLLYAPRGFDFWMDVNGTLMMQGPRALDPDNVIPVLTLTDATTVVSVDWTNSGPRATETVAFSSGTGNGRGWYRDTYAPSVRAYRRWKRTLSVADPSASLTSTSDVVAGLASAAGFLDRFPHKELKLRVKPDSLVATNQAFGYYSMLGEAINVNLTQFAPYHHINANFYITSQSYSFDASGNAVMDFTLDQIYGTINTPPIQ